MDCSLPGSSVHRIFPGKNIRVGCQSVQNCPSKGNLKAESEFSLSLGMYGQAQEYILFVDGFL